MGSSDGISSRLQAFKTHHSTVGSGSNDRFSSSHMKTKFMNYYNSAKEMVQATLEDYNGPRISSASDDMKKKAYGNNSNSDMFNTKKGYLDHPHQKTGMKVFKVTQRLMTATA